MADTIEVPSVDEYAAKVDAAGGETIMSKSPIPGVGWFVMCKDTEGNKFGLMEMDESVQSAA